MSFGWKIKGRASSDTMAAIEAIKWILGRPVRTLKIVGAVVVGLGASKMASP